MDMSINRPEYMYIIQLNCYCTAALVAFIYNYVFLKIIQLLNVCIPIYIYSFENHQVDINYETV